MLLLSILESVPGFVSTVLLALEFGKCLFIFSLTKNPEIRKTHAYILSKIGGLEWERNTKFGTICYNNVTKYQV